MDHPRIVTCPLTGRVGSYVPGRDQRPSPPRLRGEVGPDTEAACPFCTGEVPRDPHPARASRGGLTWTSCPNRYPAITGSGAGAHVAYSVRHGPALTRGGTTQRHDWAAMLDVQQQLARRTTSWSLIVANIGPTAGASQPHPHGQVLDLPEPPPVAARRTRLLADPAVATALLADELTIEVMAGIRLVAPAVPYGPGDLRLVPENDGGFLDADPDVLAPLIVRWTATLPDGAVDQTRAPDGKLIVHDRVGSAGRWYADLLATGQHGPVAGITPFVELDAPADVRAAQLRTQVG
jgi:hypothetical protein